MCTFLNTYSLIDRAPGNDVTSLTTYTTHTRVSDTNIIIIRYIENKIYSEKSIPMIALWCPAFSNDG